LKTAKNATSFQGSISRLFEMAKTSLQSNNSSQKPLLSKSDFADLTDLIDSFAFNRSTTPTTRTTMEMVIKSEKGDAARVKMLTELKSTVTSRTASKLLFENEIFRMLRPISSQQLAATEKKRIIDDVLRKIVTITDKQFQFEMLIFSARKTLDANQKDSTRTILNEAELLIKTFPKNSSDYSNSWLLADVFFTIDENRSFIIIENIFTQLNHVINAYAIFNEFSSIDNFLDSEEVMMESAGNAQIIGLSNLSRPLLKKMLEKDFNRTMNISNRLDRPEFRLEARTLILNALLNPPKTPQKSSTKQ
jgi:hypothetical protein